MRELQETASLSANWVVESLRRLASVEAVQSRNPSKSLTDPGTHAVNADVTHSQTLAALRPQAVRTPKPWSIMEWVGPLDVNPHIK